MKLYVLMNKDRKFVKGGGSSTKPYIRAFDNEESAKRSARLLPGAKVVEFSAYTGHLSDEEEDNAE